MELRVHAEDPLNDFYQVLVILMFINWGKGNEW
jgi:hypothetical protein